MLEDWKDEDESRGFQKRWGGGVCVLDKRWSDKTSIRTLLSVSLILGLEYGTERTSSGTNNGAKVATSERNVQTKGDGSFEHYL